MLEQRVWSRSPLVSFGWTLRDYVKRVWDNAGEDNVLFLAGGIAFNIAVQFGATGDDRS